MASELLTTFTLPAPTRPPPVRVFHLPGKHDQKRHGKGATNIGYVEYNDLSSSQHSMWSLGERAALYHYTGSGAYPLNSELREKGDLTPEHARARDMIDSAFSKVPALDHTVKVYRGVDNKIYEKLKSADSFVDDGFVSTSRALYGAKSFNVLEILVPRGTKALFLGNATDYLDEGEVLLPRGTRFKNKGKDLWEIKHS